LGYGGGEVLKKMGRTIPSFRITLAMEKEEYGSHFVMPWIN
jgi:hypothetical protein